MRTVAIVVAILVLTGTGGIAYAWDDGSGENCGGSHSDRCPSRGIFWTSYSTPVASAPYVKCTISIDSDSDTLFEEASNLAPGQYCGFSARLTNTEEQAVTITEPWWGEWRWQTGDCQLFTYSDNVHVPAHSPPNSIAGGQSFAYQGTLSLSNSAGNACEGAFFFFHVVIIGLPFERCSCDR